MEIQGTVAEGYEPVREAFAANFAHRGERGAAFALYRGGRAVVDLWGGSADGDGGGEWAEDTVQVLRSVTKGLSSAVVMLLVERGLLELDTPVGDYWPQFKASGKDSVTVRQLLSHQAGLPALEVPLSVALAVDGVSGPRSVAEQRPLWEPGTAHGYHPHTFSWLTGELVLRATGRTLGTVLAEEVAGPLGLDLWIGLPPEQRYRVGRLAAVAAPSAASGAAPRFRPRREVAEAYADPGSPTRRAFGAIDPAPDENTDAWRSAELPGANGIATARAVARCYAALIGDVDGAARLLRPETLAAATAEQVSGPDRVLIAHSRFGLGFMLHGPASPMTSAAAFGHPGRGGSLGFADPALGIGFGYVTNGMLPTVVNDPRAQALVRAVRECVAADAAPRLG
ncbi:serine hydrolase [Streptacidiphilus sp. P02-A3a]|uniref:serine hydrolase domain-containing protein n=1 Tax=Streptacidiphilus sp. P02-A3a TaxID=2704468 RepID=UPI0015F86967|nr:serine hydrolase domain-containing protein [Streptacidiphilus sp. P02-A3a]QMU69960.1 beta-lactamase family protein [Streptacidiphilus sp. P02-A3a]